MLLTRLAAVLFLSSFTSPSPKQNVAITRDGRPVCGSVMLNATTVLTAAHCVDGERYAEIRCGSADVPARVVAASMDEDLALLVPILPCNEAGFTEVALSDPPLGSSVRAIGYPGGRARVSEGIVSSYEVSELGDESNPQYTHAKHLVLVSDTKIYYGNSGGGLFNANGELVGIASQLDSAGYGYWIPASSIQTFLSGI